MTTGLTDKRYCFGFGVDKWGILGYFPSAASSLETLDKQEAKRIFRAFDDEGLVHSIWTGVTPYVIGLCNCDRDCGALHSWMECGCNQLLPGGICLPGELGSVHRLQNLHEPVPVRGTILFFCPVQGLLSPKKCFGCGVCRAACPNNAIDLIPRKAVPEAANSWI